MISGIERDIGIKDRQYTELNNHWNSIILKLESAADLQGFSSHSTKKHSDNTYLFSIFGLAFYLRFSHSFDCGCLEYGKVEEHTLGKLDMIKIKTVVFDRMGNFKGDFSSYPVSEFESIHAKVVAVDLCSFPACDDNA